MLHNSVKQRSAHVLHGVSLKSSNFLCLMFMSGNRLFLRLSGKLLLWNGLVPISAVLLLMAEDFETLLGLSRRHLVYCLIIISDYFCLIKIT